MTGTVELLIELELITKISAEACTFVEGLSKEAFLGDRRTQQAVIMNLQIAGEGVRKLLSKQESLDTKYPDVPWRSIRAMRNRIAHGYYELNLDIVWDTVTQSLPTLISQLETIRRDLENTN
jgi:uncharacterized protein with HEPN domain